jgi:hypothetical protein
MRTTFRLTVVLAGAAALAGCAHFGVRGRSGPDEFAVQRQAPLSVPPDFALTPPAPGAPRPAQGTAAQQALDALFGGPAPRSAGETGLLQRAGTPDEGIRSAVGDPTTHTVDKGTATEALVKAPESSSQEASAATQG